MKKLYYKKKLKKKQFKYNKTNDSRKISSFLSTIGFGKCYLFIQECLLIQH